jgi:hypothetical protein
MRSQKRNRSERNERPQIGKEPKRNAVKREEPERRERPASKRKGREPKGGQGRRTEPNRAAVDREEKKWENGGDRR